MKALLVDDEANNLTTLAWEIQENCPDLNVVGTCRSAEEARQSIAQHNPDIVFLDIQMPHENGFDLLKSLSQIYFDVIFTTAYDQYAIDAFKVNAADYLLKPVDREDLIAAVDRVRQRREKQNDADQIMSKLIKALDRRPGRDRIALPTNDGLEFVPATDILYAEASSNYTIIHYNNKRSVISKTLKEVESLLQPQGFIRVHNSFLVNPEQIQKYIKDDGGYLIMSNGSQLSVSRSRKEELMQWFGKI